MSSPSQGASWPEWTRPHTRAALLTRGLAEISRLAVYHGANPLTLGGLSGMGDLVLTCTGDLSRNRAVGYKLGTGMSLDDILSEMNEVAEGVKTTRVHTTLLRETKSKCPLPLKCIEFSMSRNPHKRR